MKSTIRNIFLAVLVLSGLAGCADVPSGNVGVIVERYGDDKGVNLDVKGPGRHFVIPFTTEVFLFPTYAQTYTWTKDPTEGSPNNEEFLFQDTSGLSVSTDVSITYYIPKENAAKVFTKYRRGVDEITSMYLRSMVRDALADAASKMSVEEIYGPGRSVLQAQVNAKVKARAAESGIVVETVNFVGAMRLPASVMQSINAKTAAIQIAQQKENELRAAEADAAKKVAAAKGEAESMRIQAEALRQNSQLLEKMAIEKWDGALPQYMGGGSVPFVKGLK